MRLTFEVKLHEPRIVHLIVIHKYISQTDRLLYILEIFLLLSIFGFLKEYKYKMQFSYIYTNTYVIYGHKTTPKIVQLNLWVSERGNSTGNHISIMR